jgi:ferredoxin
MGPAIVLHVIDRAGQYHRLTAVEGWRVMEILRDHGVGVAGLCGGAGTCATCHVVVDPAFAALLPAPREDERDTLDELPVVAASSRLACQIIWQSSLDGLVVTLPPEV